MQRWCKSILGKNGVVLDTIMVNKKGARNKSLSNTALEVQFIEKYDQNFYLNKENYVRWASRVQHI